MTDGQSLSEVVNDRGQDILKRWVALQTEVAGTRNDLLSPEQLRQQSSDFLSAFAAAVATDEGQKGTSGPAWEPVRELLTRVSNQRARQGFTPAETAVFVFSLKEPLFEETRRTHAAPETQTRQIWAYTRLLDELGLFTIEVHQKSREEVIARQQNEMLELSTPVVTLWKGVLALPLIGTLDSERTQVVMENLLQRIVDSGSRIAILDITGVPTVDTLVAQHLLKTVAAARLMGADCIISGIRPQIAQTIVHLGIDLESVTTKATLADAFAVALSRLGLAVTKDRPPSATGPSPRTGER